MISLAVVVIFAWLVISFIKLYNRGGSIHYSGGSGAVNLVELFWMWVVGYAAIFIAMMSLMSRAWEKFAKSNGFTLLKHMRYPTPPDSPFAKMKVPSFVGKPLRISLFPIIGTYAGNRFGFFTRQYKEGGTIRWRERKMDTVVWIELPQSLPRIVVDSRLNERARRSNISKRYSFDQLLHFEGATGDRYFVYAAKGNQIAALQLFTPDVLQVFFELLPLVDIEVKGKTMWFVWRYGVLRPALADEMFAGVTAFMHEFSKQALVARYSESEITAELM